MVCGQVSSKATIDKKLAVMTWFFISQPGCRLVRSDSAIDLPPLLGYQLAEMLLNGLKKSA